MNRAEPQLRDALVVGLDSLLRSPDRPTVHAAILAIVDRGMTDRSDALRGRNGEPTNESLLFEATLNVARRPEELKTPSIEAEFEKLRTQAGLAPTPGGLGAIAYNARQRFGDINLPLAKAVGLYNRLTVAKELESKFGVGFPGGQALANELNGVIDQLDAARGQRAPAPQQGFQPQQGQPQQFPLQQAPPQQAAPGQFQPAAQANQALGGQPQGVKLSKPKIAGLAVLGYVVTSALALAIFPPLAPLAFVSAVATPLVAKKVLNNQAAKAAASNAPQLTAPGGPAAHTAVQPHDPRHQPARHRR